MVCLGSNRAEPSGTIRKVDANLKELLRDLRNRGANAEFYAMDDACAVCRALAGKIFDPREAPSIPVPDCLNDACRCDYVPA